MLCNLYVPHHVCYEFLLYALHHDVTNVLPNPMSVACLPIMQYTERLSVLVVNVIRIFHLQHSCIDIINYICIFHHHNIHLPTDEGLCCGAYCMF